MVDAPKKRPKDEPDPWLIPMGKRLAEVREVLWKKPSKAARAFGITPARWGNYESGLRPIPLSLLVWLSEHHDVPADFILRGRIRSSLDADVHIKLFGAQILELAARGGQHKN